MRVRVKARKQRHNVAEGTAIRSMCSSVCEHERVYAKAVVMLLVEKVEVGAQQQSQCPPIFCRQVEQSGIR